MSRLNKESISELVGKARPDKDWGNRVFSYSNNVRKVDDELSGAIRFTITSLSPDEYKIIQKLLLNKLKKEGYRVKHYLKSKNSNTLDNDADSILFTGPKSTIFVSLVYTGKRSEIPEFAGPRKEISGYLVTFYEALK
jgi:hypothetical protein